LILPDTWLKSPGIVEVKLGGQSVINSTSAAQAGTGYVKKSWTVVKFKISGRLLKSVNPNNHIAWEVLLAILGRPG
jgi:hypothetical protein